jgi:pimeloyl-ACP methyl ester carboxylesterase
MWRPQCEGLQDVARLVVPDLRGYGSSGVTPGTVLLDEMALDLAVLLDELGLEKAVLGGLSMGGQIVLDFCRLFPTRVLGLVLAASSAPAETADSSVRRYQVAERLLQEGMEWYAREELARFLAPATIHGRPEIAEHVKSMMVSTNPVGAAAALRGRAERRDHVTALTRIRAPAIVVVGTEDVFTPVLEAERLAAGLPNARLAVMPGVAHLPNLEAPEEFNFLMREFLISRLED